MPTARRSQQERRHETRTRLLAATQTALVERGYAGTTTTEVCRRAGVSQGALFKHFASKGELLAATAERLFANLIDAYRESLPPWAGVDDRAAAAVELLWDAFEDPRLLAAIELYAAARTAWRGSCSPTPRRAAPSSTRWWPSWCSRSRAPRSAAWPPAGATASRRCSRS
jgi:AcrR family transcriptional regulator